MAYKYLLLIFITLNCFANDNSTTEPTAQEKTYTASTLRLIVAQFVAKKHDAKAPGFQGLAARLPAELQELVIKYKCHQNWKNTKSETFSPFINGELSRIFYYPKLGLILVFDEKQKNFVFRDADLENVAPPLFAQTNEYKGQITTVHNKQMHLRFYSSDVLGFSTGPIFIDGHLVADSEFSPKQSIDNPRVLFLPYRTTLELCMPDKTFYTLNDDDLLESETYITKTPDCKNVVTFSVKDNIKFWPLTNKDLANEQDKKPSTEIECRARNVYFITDNKFVALSKVFNRRFAYFELELSLWENKLE